MFLLQIIHLPYDNLFRKSLINILPFKMLNVSLGIHLPKFNPCRYNLLYIAFCIKDNSCPTKGLGKHAKIPINTIISKE